MIAVGLVGAALRMMREDLGWTPQQAADAAWCSVDRINGMEAGDPTMITPRFVGYLAKIYGEHLAARRDGVAVVGEIEASR